MYSDSHNSAVEVHLQSSDEPDAEYVDGVIEARPIGEYDHAAWHEAILAYFREDRREWNIRVLPELRIQISRTRYRFTDVTVLDRDLPMEQIITVPPIAVFEILSPEDTMSRILVKRDDYEQMGIANIYVVEPAISDKLYSYSKGCLGRCPHQQWLAAAELILPRSRKTSSNR